MFVQLPVVSLLYDFLISVLGDVAYFICVFLCFFLFYCSLLLFSGTGLRQSPLLFCTKG